MTRSRRHRGIVRRFLPASVAAFGPGRSLLLFLFPVAFAVISALMITRAQQWIEKRPAGSVALTGSDLHLLVSGSLFLAGVHPDDITVEESRPVPASQQRTFRTEVVTGEEFTLSRWLDDLRTSLERAGSGLRSFTDDGTVVVEISVPAGETGGSSGRIVERLLITRRPHRHAPAAPRHAGGPAASLVIDDFGQSTALFRQFVDLGIPFTASILPSLPHSADIYRAAVEIGVEVLLHQPMEPVDYPEKRPGPGALLLDMSDDEIRSRLRKNLALFPAAAGINNHMGSRLTADRRVMEILMSELQGRPLFFLDSFTSPRSRAYETALSRKIPAVARDIFLDARDEPEFIRNQIRAFLDLARSRSVAVGIGHPYPATIAALREMREEILSAGIAFVPVSSLASAGSAAGAVTAAPVETNAYSRN